MNHFYQPDDDTWEGRMDSYIEESEKQITALRAALDQERADARRYRAWRDGCVHETSKVAVALAKCVWPSDYDLASDALLSGRGEGGNGGR